MIYSVYLPLLVSVLLAALSPLLAARCGPTRAAMGLVVAASLAAAAWTWALLLLAAALLHEAPVVTERIPPGAAPFTDPLAPVVSAVALALVTVGAYRAVVVVRRCARMAAQLRALCAACRGTGDAGSGLGSRHAEGGAGDGELLVVPTAALHALAVPGRRGRGGNILVSSGMLKVLDPAGHRVLLAHERAHLTGRHHAQRVAVEVAAALNPLLIPARDAVAFLLERSADEHAAAAVGDRRAAAQALATAALAGTEHGTDGVRLAYQQLEVTRRVAALQAPALPERRLPPAGLLVLAAIGAIAATDATVSFLRLAHTLLPGL